MFLCLQNSGYIILSKGRNIQDFKVKVHTLRHLSPYIMKIATLCISPLQYKFTCENFALDKGHKTVIKYELKLASCSYMQSLY